MKKIISILLAVLMLVSCAVVATSAYGWDDPDIWTTDEAIADYEFVMEEEVETYKYYFLMPNGKNGDIGDDDSVDEEGKPIGHYGEFAPTWFIEMADGSTATATAGIYWWGSTIADPAAWVGYLPSGSDESDPYVFYANVPTAVTTIIWNNAVDGGKDNTQPIYFCAAQSINIPCEYYEAGESPNYPDGTESFNNMIFVIDPDLVSISEFSQKQTCGGEWYYYYGNGCYGFTADGTEADCLRGDHFDADGNHVIPEHDPIQVPGTLPSVEPTDEPTEPSDEPTEPSDEPTEPSVEPTEPSVEPTEPVDPPTPDFLLGDADQDGEVSVMDATTIQRYKAEKIVLEAIALLAADTDKDGEVSVMDATRIQRFKANKIESL